VIKSGGEWISSVDVENTLMAHPAVLEAAVFGVVHPKFMERPVALVVLRSDWRSKPWPEVRRDIERYIATKFAKWWLPDAVICVESIDKTSVGKFDKKVLRVRFKDALMPSPAKL